MHKLLLLGALLCLPTFAHAEGDDEATENVSEGMPAVDAMGNPTGMTSEAQVFEPKKFEFTEKQRAMFEEHRGEMMLRNDRYLLDIPSKAAWNPAEEIRFRKTLQQNNVKQDDEP